MCGNRVVGAAAGCFVQQQAFPCGGSCCSFLQLIFFSLLFFLGKKDLFDTPKGEKEMYVGLTCAKPVKVGNYSLVQDDPAVFTTKHHFVHKGRAFQRKSIQRELSAVILWPPPVHPPVQLRLSPCHSHSPNRCSSRCTGI